MKITVKTFSIILIHFGTFLILTFFMDYLDRLVAGEFSGGLDIKDWWYELVNYHLIHYLIATSLLSGLLFFVYEMVNVYITNKIRIAFGILIGCLSMVVLNYCYWKYIQDNCYGLEWSTLEQSFTISYGSGKYACLFWSLYTCFILSAGMVVKNMERFLHLRKKVAWHQIFCLSEDIFIELIYIEMPYVVLISGNYFMVGSMGVTILPIFVFFVLVKIVGYFIVKIARFNVLNQYYESVEKDSEKTRHLVIFQESPYIKKSFIVEYLFDKKVNKKTKTDDIWFYPNDLGCIGEVFIKLDIYDEAMLMRKEVENEKIVKCMAEKRGIFNLAYNLDDKGGYTKYYDSVYESEEELLNALKRLDRYTDFKKFVNMKLEQIDLSKLTGETYISREIVEFRNYLRNQTDEFIVFDFLIKWLEIINYLFSLTIISKHEIQISTEIKKKIEYGDFDKWRKMLYQWADEDVEFDTRLNNCAVTGDIIGYMKDIFRTITLREYEFQEDSIQELLDSSNELRNYTRGHGVFTFEITQDMNGKLIEIIVFLMNCLIKCQSLENSMDNLEKLGWVIHLGDIPYYLYSIDKQYKEFKYESFQMSKSIALPLDIYR